MCQYDYTIGQIFTYRSYCNLGVDIQEGLTMKTRLIIVVVFLVAIAVSVADKAIAEADFGIIAGKLTEAQEAYQQADYKKAVEVLDALLELFPEHDEAKRLRLKAIEAIKTQALGRMGVRAGSRLLSQRKYDEAIAMFSRVLKRDPTNVEALQGIVEARARRKSHARFLYWTWMFVESENIHRVDLDGESVENIIGGYPTMRMIALDTDHGKIYWTEDDRIQQANLDGTGEEVLIEGLSDPQEIVLDVAKDKIYWTEDDKIQQANLDGTGEEVLIEGLSDPKGIALDVTKDKIYWIVEDRILRASIGSTNIEVLVDGLDNLSGIALDFVSGKIYWTVSNIRHFIYWDFLRDIHPDNPILPIGEIQRANLDGTQVETIL